MNYQTINVIPVDDITDDAFLDRLAEKVAQKIKAQSERSSTEELKDAEVAKILRKSVSTVRRMKRDGTLPTIQKGGVRVVRLCDVLSIEK